MRAVFAITCAQSGNNRADESTKQLVRAIELLEQCHLFGHNKQARYFTVHCSHIPFISQLFGHH